MNFTIALLSITVFCVANATNFRRSSDADLDNAFADVLPRFGRDLAGWNRGVNGAVNVNRAFDDRESRVPTPQSYLEYMIESGKYGSINEIISAVQAVQRRAAKQRRHDLIKLGF